MQLRAAQMNQFFFLKIKTEKLYYYNLKCRKGSKGSLFPKASVLDEDNC